MGESCYSVLNRVNCEKNHRVPREMDNINNIIMIVQQHKGRVLIIAGQNINYTVLINIITAG